MAEGTSVTVGVSLQWYGTATWKLQVDDFTIWLDAYIERAPTAAPPPQRAKDIRDGQLILIGHSHFDHLAEAGLVAKNTGAIVVGSQLSGEIVSEEGVPDGRIVTCSGGEDLRFGPVRIRALRSLHGFNGLREWPDPKGLDRAGRIAAMRAADAELCEAALGHMRGIPPKQMQDGGPLAYVIDAGGLRIFWHDTPGLVRESWDAAAALKPGVAILAAAAAFSTPNIDGEPDHEGQVHFVEMMAGILQPSTVILNHHDDWCPPITFHLPEDRFEEPLSARGAALRRCEIGGTLTLA
jgi:L-ascorbate metabolism protein UlaG (beta-lactamase superfamily)